MEANIADSSLFTQIDPEAIEKHCRRFDLTPEKKLMLAVLTDAIKTVRNPTRRVYMDYIGKNNTSKKRRILDDETRKWFDSPEEEWTFSFRHICYALGLEPDYVRKGVMKGRGKVWKDKRTIKREAVGRDRYQTKSHTVKHGKKPKGQEYARSQTAFEILQVAAVMRRASISYPVVTREIIK